MNDRDWLILKVIADEKNITTASERLYTTQSALTYRLKNIEAELNAEIFIRTSKGVIPTPQGEALIQYAARMLKEFEDVKMNIGKMGSEIRGTLKLGLSRNFAKHRLPEILDPFCKAFPKVEVFIKAGVSSYVMEVLEKDEISLAIVRGDFPWPEGKCLISEEPILLMARQDINPEELPRLPYIAYESDTSLKKELNEWWRDYYSMAPNTIMQINDVDTCRNMVSSGLGYSILPAADCNLLHYPDLCVLPLKYRDGTPLVRRTWMLYRKASLELPAVSKFVEYVKKWVDLQSGPVRT